VLVVEVAPIVALLALCMYLAVQGGAMLSYTNAAAEALHAPSTYIPGVMGPGQAPGVSR
jgi:multicomponent K+:H+ antiporter subunit D